MNYIYGFSTFLGQKYENLKTYGEEHTDFSDYIQTITSFDDGTEIIDYCHIIKKYASKESNGVFYDWYIIDNHYRNVDTSKKIQNDVDLILVSILER